MTNQTDTRIIKLMLEKIEHLMIIADSYSDEEIQNNFIYSDTIQFEFEKLYEDSTRLSPEFRITHPSLPIDKLRGIRNKVAHNYEAVSMQILCDTIRDDIPSLKVLLEETIKDE